MAPTAAMFGDFAAGSADGVRRLPGLRACSGPVSAGLLRVGGPLLLLLAGFSFLARLARLIARALAAAQILPGQFDRRVEFAQDLALGILCGVAGVEADAQVIVRDLHQVQNALFETGGVSAALAQSADQRFVPLFIRGRGVAFGALCFGVGRLHVGLGGRRVALIGLAPCNCRRSRQ